MKNQTRLFALATLFFFVPLLAQQKQKVNEADVFQDETSEYTKSLKKIIVGLEATINERLKDLERKHDILVVLMPKYEKRQTIVTEDIPFQVQDGYESNLLKYITFQFNSGKVSDITLASESKRIYYEVMFENKKIVFKPTDLKSSEVTHEVFEKTEITRLNEMSLENQIKALRLLEASLRSSIYRIDILLALYKDKKDRKNLYHIEF
ncbi:hypothetical protein [Leptospira licerasiae]|uniref:DUF4468 domain-containing protein n=1 Tax=Leptospira licerasiae str. MMD4847 TaxID=1049971 RepID=A0ABN0H7Q9_9LEPT|nr:hypothetical protein [Leptospira licerasiae]EID99725.1 hypothetical protein LEP1GSC185_0648 [Leptospira licerasiae serovar Varillal str. VAR 010]EJZ41664.1 hypothetical protein LEP1GSC178_3898 [Leptospira licerasiae str. MMD4847]TGM91100.1 hypothetical protein EHR05_10095 [Leptospira licerasiae]